MINWLFVLKSKSEQHFMAFCLKVSSTRVASTSFHSTKYLLHLKEPIISCVMWSFNLCHENEMTLLIINIIPFTLDLISNNLIIL